MTSPYVVSSPATPSVVVQVEAIFATPDANRCGPVERVAVIGDEAVTFVSAMSPPAVIDPTCIVQAAVADVTAAWAGIVARAPSSTADAAAAEARFR